MQLEQVPNYIFASTPKGLRQKMLENNIVKGVWFKYFDIQYVGKLWYAWYFEQSTTMGEIETLTEE